MYQNDISACAVNNSKCQKHHPENHQQNTKNLWKFCPEAFPNACLKISHKITSKISAKWQFWPPTWSLGGGRRRHFLSIFRSGNTLGGQNGPKTPPKSFWDPSRPQCSMKCDGLFLDFLMILVGVLVIVCTLGSLFIFVKPVGSQSRKLPSRQGFRPVSYTHLTLPTILLV